MAINRVKIFVLTLFAIPMFAFAAFNTNGVGAISQTTQNTFDQTPSASQDFDVAATYKSKCAACHTAKATKWFEQSKMDEVHVEIIMKGKKAEKPPHMPSYGDKGMTEAQAKLLVAYMRQISAPAKE